MKRSKCYSFASSFALCKSSLLIAFVLFLSIIICSSINAFALNQDYLDNSYWIDNSDYSVTQIHKKSVGNTLDGISKYYIDNDDCEMYFYFSVSESSMDVDYADVKINFDAKSENDKYEFSVDSSGMVDYTSQSAENFNVLENFEYFYESDSGIYIAGIETNNREKLNFNISLYINGHKYLIYQNLALEPTEETTTQKSVKTTVAKTTKQSKKTVTTAKSGNTKSTTKFSGTPAQTKSSANLTTTSSTATNEVATSVLQCADVVADSSTQSSGINLLSNKKNLFICIGCAVALVGLIVLIISLIVKKREDKVKIDNENKEGSDT
jgi:hypothetical protein